jgi:hypothetical protein
MAGACAWGGGKNDSGFWALPHEAARNEALAAAVKANCRESLINE